ncbi:hypothetical protein BDW42DRAFT_56489 [Aspergillus taichungensis]|uniref:Secreted protein n=1 Tax=Aspergillus taichungensis TaxID=482145 RepID=A0A2J5I9J3_9EURO|nr:hypothetical protein BDW42DRAFT_56489 [Aspergillus taichungensis]
MILSVSVFLFSLCTYPCAVGSVKFSGPTTDHHYHMDRQVGKDHFVEEQSGSQSLITKPLCTPPQQCYIHPVAAKIQQRSGNSMRKHILETSPLRACDIALNGDAILHNHRGIQGTQANPNIFPFPPLAEQCARWL